MGFFDPGKLLVVLVVALIVLGPERLPRAAWQAGAVWRELTRVRDQVTEELRSALPIEEIRAAVPVDDLPAIPRIRKGAVSGFLADLTRPGTGSADGDEGPAGGDESPAGGTGMDPGRGSSERAPAPTAAPEAPGGPGETEIGGPATGPTGADGFPVLLDDASMN